MKILQLFSYSLLFFCWSLLIGYLSPVYALYDPRTLPNHKLGVHILHPEEITRAAEIVNSSGGDWGYVTIPIQPTDRDKVKWQNFMQACQRLHLIPVIRITTIPQGGTWESAADSDLVDFANFLDGLSWPVENRYIVLFNEVNRSAEWGGTVNPEKYASIVKNARTIFKERSADFFLLGPALDDALPNSATSLSAKNYLERMSAVDPAIWSYFDGWAAHSYPNPGFTASPDKAGYTSIVSYRSFLKLLKLAPKPVFITETGWNQEKLSRGLITSYWQQAWKIWQNDQNVVAVTPFVLVGGAQFKEFSLVGDGDNLTISGEALKNLPKTAGNPRPGSISPVTKDNLDHQTTSSNLPWGKTSEFLMKLENIFRVILGLPEKAGISLGDRQLLVELAETPKQWEKGLSGRPALTTTGGMLFLFRYPHIPVFWMKDTLLPLDIIWINENKVVEITPDVPVPTSDKIPTYSPSVPADMVLEVPAGWTAANSVTVGDELIL